MCVCVFVCVCASVCVCVCTLACMQQARTRLQQERKVLKGELSRAHKETMERDLEILNWAINDDARDSKLLGAHAQKVTVLYIHVYICTCIYARYINIYTYAQKITVL